MQDGADLITILDIKGNYKYVSPSSKSIFGVDGNILIGKNVFDYIHEDDNKTVIVSANEKIGKYLKEGYEVRQLSFSYPFQAISSNFLNFLEKSPIDFANTFRKM